VDSQLFQEAIEYEKLTQAVYQAILQREQSNIVVEHNTTVAGRSGVEHQVDVFWKFKQAGIEHTVLVECKNYSSKLTLEKVRNFFAVLHDTGGSGIMVTRTGYQTGVEAFAKHYGISLKQLSAPVEADWEGRIKTIRVELRARVMESSDERPVKVTMALTGLNAEHTEKLLAAISGEEVQTAPPPMIVLCDINGEPVTEELRYWLPKQISILDKLDGGPYSQILEFSDKYIYARVGGRSEELVKLTGMKVEYYVTTVDTRQFSIHGEEIVDSVLRDHFSGHVEHMHRKNQ
jgi:hypothetical protein